MKNFSTAQDTGKIHNQAFMRHFFTECVIDMMPNTKLHTTLNPPQSQENAFSGQDRTSALGAPCATPVHRSGHRATASCWTFAPVGER
jgi:hypothetical protein